MAIGFIKDHLQTDDLTILLALIAATVFLLHNLYKPQPLVHPILLGRQSDVARVRRPGESAVYRNYNTGLLGRFPVRPTKDVHIIGDFVRPELENRRTLWATRLTNGALQDRVAAFGTGLIRVAHLQPQKSKVLLLLNDCLEFIVADLALASHSMLSLTLTSSTLLSNIIEVSPPSAIICNAFLLPHLLEHIYDSGSHDEHIVIMVGEPTPQTMASVASNVKLFRFEDLEREGTKQEKILSPLPKPSDVFTVSFFESSPGQIKGVHLTHENITAGVSAIRCLLPASYALSAFDTISSVHSLSSAYGRAVAYTAIHEGTSFATIPGGEVFCENFDESRRASYAASGLTAKKYPIPPTTIMFIRPGQVATLTWTILDEAKKSWLYSVAWRHKLAGLKDGFITNQSLWDRLVFDGARTRVLGDEVGALRGVVIGGGLLDASVLTPARVVFSIPVINTFTHPISASPILASHLLDLQDFPPSQADETPQVAHCGAPSVNVEVKLVGMNDEAVEAGADPRGLLIVQGPPVGKVVKLGYGTRGEEGDDYVDVGAGSTIRSPGNSGMAAATVEEMGSGEAEWVRTGVEARVLTNGSFVPVREKTVKV